MKALLASLFLMVIISLPGNSLGKITSQTYLAYPLEFSQCVCVLVRDMGQSSTLLLKEDRIFCYIRETTAGIVHWVFVPMSQAVFYLALKKEGFMGKKQCLLVESREEDLN